MVFTFVYVFLVLLNNLIQDFYVSITLLFWAASLFIPEFLSSVYLVKKHKRVMSKKERQLIALLSVFVKMTINLIHLIFTSSDRLFFGQLSIGYLLIILAGTIAVLWLAEYFIYYMSERISAKIFITTI